MHYSSSGWMRVEGYYNRCGYRRIDGRTGHFANWSKERSVTWWNWILEFSRSRRGFDEDFRYLKWMWLRQFKSWIDIYAKNTYPSRCWNGIYRNGQPASVSSPSRSSGMCALLQGVDSCCSRRKNTMFCARALSSVTFLHFYFWLMYDV